MNVSPDMKLACVILICVGLHLAAPVLAIILLRRKEPVLKIYSVKDCTACADRLETRAELEHPHGLCADCDAEMKWEANLSRPIRPESLLPSTVNERKHNA